MSIEKQVWQALSTVLDPELGIDIVSLGLIYSVEVVANNSQESFVRIVMTLTTPGCPLAGTIDALIRSAVSVVDGLNIDDSLEIQLTFDPPWVQDMMSDEAKAQLGFY